MHVHFYYLCIPTEYLNISFKSSEIQVFVQEHLIICSKTSIVQECSLSKGVMLEAENTEVNIMGLNLK